MDWKIVLIIILFFLGLLCVPQFMSDHNLHIDTACPYRDRGGEWVDDC